MFSNQRTHTRHACHMHIHRSGVCTWEGGYSGAELAAVGDLSCSSQHTHMPLPTGLDSRAILLVLPRLGMAEVEVQHLSRSRWRISSQLFYRTCGVVLFVLGFAGHYRSSPFTTPYTLQYRGFSSSAAILACSSQNGRHTCVIGSVFCCRFVFCMCR